MTDEFERALLGAVLAGYRDVRELTRTVNGSDFASPQHETIWQTALALHAEGKPTSPLEVMHAMGTEAHRLPSGATYLTDLQAPVVVQAPFYAQQVRDASIRRQIAGLGIRCQQIVRDVDTEPADLVARIRAWSDEIGTAPTRETSTVGDVLEKVIDIAQHGQPHGQPTPWAELTSLLRGWFPGQLVTFGARPGVGKTIALENVATHAARAGDWVLFVSLEMSPEEVLLRTMAHTAGVDLSKLQRGNQWLSEHDWKSIERASGVIEETKIRFADQPSQTLASIRANVADLSQEAKRKGERLGMVVVDYIQLITATSKRGESRQQQLGAITRGLKLLAREFDVPVITAAQLNRAPMSRSNPMPMLSDLREAGDIEQDSNVVILMHEETVDDGGQSVATGEIKLVVAKNRNGPRGTVTVQRWGHYAKLTAPGQAA